jgi:hypothetical protein
MLLLCTYLPTYLPSYLLPLTTNTPAQHTQVESYAHSLLLLLMCSSGAVSLPFTHSALVLNCDTAAAVTAS